MNLWVGNNTSSIQYVFGFLVYLTVLSQLHGWEDCGMIIAYFKVLSYYFTIQYTVLKFCVVIDL